ncbi:acid protease [Ramaria rubella]|nr:acid protease [Ramaria rubella]
MAAIVLTLLLAFSGLRLSQASQRLAARRPLATISLRPPKPNVPAHENVPKADILLRDMDSRTFVARGLTGIENVAYTPSSYNIILNVGEIPFEVALDTGSADFWLISDGCHTSQCKGTPSFPLTTYASPTFSSVNDNQTAFNISFADTTSASGFVARENVQINDIQASGQAFGLVTNSNLTLGRSVSGILGLGFPRLSQIAASIPNAPPFLSGLVEAGRLAYPLFGLSLTTNTSGTLSMGAIDKSVVTNTSLISWHDVVPFAPLPNQNATETSPYLHWALPLDNLTVNGTATNLHPTYPNITGPSPLALLDVGDNGIYGPLEDVAAIFLALGTIRQVTRTKHLPNSFSKRLSDIVLKAGAWAIPCDITATMTFSFAGTNVTLQPSDYLIGPTQGDPNLCLSWPIALPPSADGLDWHLGTPFLRAVYSVFSFGVSGHEPPLIGLYPLSNTTSYTDNLPALSSEFSSLSATVSTTVPPVLLPTPVFTTPTYIFNTSVTPLPTIGQTSPFQSDMGNSTYSPLFSQAPSGAPGLALLVNATALPVVTSPGKVATLIVTDASGVHTIISTTSPIPTASLGRPPGSTGSARSNRYGLRVYLLWTLFSLSGLFVLD